jgi:hypothetical protein
MPRAPSSPERGRIEVGVAGRVNYAGVLDDDRTRRWTDAMAPHKTSTE